MTARMQKMEGGKGAADHPETRDTYKIAYIIHFLLGAGNLLPWNAFITAIDYFGYLYPTKHIEKVFSVAYMSSSVLVLLIVVSWGGWSKQLSYRLRMNMGFCIFVLSLMVAPLIDWSSSGSGPEGRSNGAYGVTVASVVVCGIADGLVGGSLIGAAGKLPKQYMQAVFAGTASSGVLISILRIITKASLPQNPQRLRTSAHFYFIVSAIILLCCALSSNLLYKLPVMEQLYKLAPDDSLFPKPKFRAVARKIRWPAFGVLMIYIVTLSIFPDFTGKSLTAIYVLKSIKKATWGCILRLVFYPLFAACLNGPKWLKTEVPVAILTFMLGVTNGYLTSVLMILAPMAVSVSEAELSAIAMVVFLGIGLVGGSVIGWFWII
ncbi:hypothetical protein D5086_032435 [Populus alba]|uniref:Uncharacterized protein n=1 Tax=Populus alba TaxID=43335 RepID=A0ACC4ALK0_POPAL